MAERGENLTILTVFCEVCTEKFSRESGHVPRILSCGHTFCECCLNKLPRRCHAAPFQRTYSKSLQRTMEICCPKCKVTSVLTGAPSDTLPKNFSYLALIEDVLKSQKTRLETCKEHPDYVLDMFCQDDEKAVCLNCAVFGNHKTHKVSKLSGFSDHQRTTIKYDIDCLNKVINDCEKLQEAVEERKSKIASKVNDMKAYISSWFSLTQERIKNKLDTKLEKVLKELDQMDSVQSNALDENFDISLNIDELKELKDKSESFLLKASDANIAKEKDLHSEIGEQIEKVTNRQLTTQHMYEVKIDDSEKMLETLTELIDAWNCTVCETKPASVESINTVVEKHSPCFGNSLRILFGEEKPNEQLTQNPFDDVSSMLWCNGEEHPPAED